MYVVIETFVIAGVIFRESESVFSAGRYIIDPNGEMRDASARIETIHIFST